MIEFDKYRILQLDTQMGRAASEPDWDIEELGLLNVIDFSIKAFAPSEKHLAFQVFFLLRSQIFEFEVSQSLKMCLQ
jgi:hypothetical protein